MRAGAKVPSQDNVPAGADEITDWDERFPADPELMASAEGDAKGLAELKQAAHARQEREPTPA
jgi:hypothetical protein